MEWVPDSRSKFKNWTMTRHYIAEISLNLSLNHQKKPQKTNETKMAIFSIAKSSFHTVKWKTLVTGGCNFQNLITGLWNGYLQIRWSDISVRFGEWTSLFLHNNYYLLTVAHDLRRIPPPPLPTHTHIHPQVIVIGQNIIILLLCWNHRAHRWTNRHDETSIPLQLVGRGYKNYSIFSIKD